MPVRVNDPKSLEEWIVRTDQRIRDLESRRIDPADGLQADPATKTMGAKISEDPGNATSIGEDGGIKSTDTITTAADHTPLIIMKEMTTGQTIANVTDTLVVWQAEVVNTGFTTTTSAVTIPEDGNYLISFQWQWANNATGVRGHKVVLGGTGVGGDVITNSILSFTFPSVTANETAQGITAVIDLAAGAVLRCFVFQSSGGNLSGGGGYFGDIRGRWQVAKMHDAFPPALTQTTE